MPYSRHAARFDNSPVKTRRRTSVHISIAAYTPRASLSVGGYRGSAAILLTDTAAQLCAAFFDRPAYPAPRCTFRPAFTVSGPPRLIQAICRPLPLRRSKDSYGYYKFSQYEPAGLISEFAVYSSTDSLIASGSATQVTT